MKKLTRLVCAVVLGFTAFSWLGAQESTIPPVLPTLPVDETTLVLADEPDPEVRAPSTSLFPYILRMVIVLAFVLAAIYGLYAVLKKSSRPPAEQDEFIRILATSPLGAGKMLHVVSVGERAWLLASADTSISVVAEIEDKEVIDGLNLRVVSSPGTPRVDFLGSLRRLLVRGSRTGAAVGPGNDFLARQRDRLKKM